MFNWTFHSSSMAVCVHRSTPGCHRKSLPITGQVPRAPRWKQPLGQIPRVTSLPRGPHMRLGDWPAGSVPGFLSGPRLELAVGANPCPCCKWCTSSPAHPPSCWPGISLWYLLPRKKGERWRTMLGQNAYSLGGAQREAPAFSMWCWRYKRWQEEHGETCHTPCGLERSLSSSPRPPPANTHVLFLSYPPAFSHFTCLCTLFPRAQSLTCCIPTEVEALDNNCRT